MKRYKINLTSMQWGLIAIDLGRISNPSESSQALQQLIKLMLDHVEVPEDVDLPFNIEEA